MTRVAIYDCGTNTTRLLVADVDGSNIKPIERLLEYTRLGQGVDASGALQSEAISRVCNALTTFAAVAKDHGVERAELIATSAVRDAENSSEFINAVTAIVNCEVRIISGEDEGDRTFQGATHDVDWKEPTLMLDIGGGSTELAVGLPDHHPEFVTSLQQGAVRLTEKYLLSDPPKPEELSQAVSVVRDELEQVLRVFPHAKSVKKLVAVAGTATTAAAVEIGLAEYDSSRIHHFVLTRAAAEDVFRTVATESLEARKKNPGLEPERADVIVGGMILLVSVMRVFDIDECVVSESDILDGSALRLGN